MMSLRLSLLFTVLGFAVAGCSSSQTSGPANSGGASSPATQKSPDEQFADLKLKFEAMTDADKRGDKGKKLIADMTAVGANLSEEGKAAAGRLLASYSLMQAGKLDPNDGPKFPDLNDPLPKEGKPPVLLNPSELPGLNPKDLKFPDRKAVDPSKLPIDPSKLLPIDPTKIPELKLPSFPDLKLPLPLPIPDPKLTTPPAIPDLKLPTIPDLKLPVPEFPKLPEGK